jgi:hypothetical protein
MNDTTPVKDTRWGSLARPDARRSLILFAVGALIGLGVAAYGLFTAAGTQTNTLPAEDVALVNGRHILRSDFVAQTEITQAANFNDTTREQRLKVLNDMLNEELLVQRGLEIDLAASDPDVRAAMVQGVNFQVTADITAQQPSDTDLRAYYEKNKDRYSGEGIMQMHDFFLTPSDEVGPADTRAILEKAAAEFRAGASPEMLKEKYKLNDPAKMDAGENFDFAAKIKLGPEVYAFAAPLQAGQTSQAFVQGINGDVHMIFMMKRSAPVARDFAAARDTVIQDFKRDAGRGVEEANIDYLKKKSEIVITPELRP